MTTTLEHSERVHGSCVAIDGAAVLILGASGSGKSATALDLLTRGGSLVADDQVLLSHDNGAILAACPSGFEGRIEARGIGILTVPHTQSAVVELLIDLDHTELQRLPPHRKRKILGVEVNMIYGRDNWHLTSGVVARLRGSRSD